MPAIDRLLPMLPAAGKPLIVLCRGAFAAFAGYRTRQGEWRDEQEAPIRQLITGWEYQDGKARGKFKGSKIVGIYLILHERQARIKQVLIVKSSA